MVVGGVMLIVFALRVSFSPVDAFVLFLDLFSQYRGFEMVGCHFGSKATYAVHLGVDNLGVFRHVGRLLDGRSSSTPLELVTDGDLLLLLERMLHRRG